MHSEDGGGGAGAGRRVRGLGGGGEERGLAPCRVNPILSIFAQMVLRLVPYRLL